MTLSMSWVRTIGDTSELIFASDSRLGGGQTWDTCPKIFELPRSDCAISFAGDTAYAYPLILQMAQAIKFYPASFDRREDITAAKTIALDVFNQMRNQIRDLPMGQKTPGDPGVRFIFGGYSWRFSRFKIWELHYQQEIDRFTFRPVKPWPGGHEKKYLAVVGDATDEAKNRLVMLLRERGKINSGGFDMEPFEILRDMIREKVDRTIGGAPQVAKVYRYMRTQHFAVEWPSSGGIPHALGRPSMNYENFDLPRIDPDHPEKHGRPRLERSQPLDPTDSSIRGIDTSDDQSIVADEASNLDFG